MSTSREPFGLHISDVAKSYNGVCVLQPLTLEVSPGETHALLGENGSGKSTLIKVLAGVVAPDSTPSGEVRVGGKRLNFASPGSAYQLGFRFVHQDLGLIGDLSVADNILINAGFPTRLGTIRQKESMASVAEDLARVGLDLDPATAVKDLGPATRTGVAVARALRPDAHSSARCIVFDEPTATLPDHEATKLMDLIRRVAAHGISVIYITHRLDEVFQIADNLTVLRDGHRIATRPTSSLDRAQLVELLVGEDYAEAEGQKPSAPGSASRVALSVRDLSAGPIRTCSLDVREGEVVGVAGVTGSGSETLLSAIFGRVGRRSGQVVVGGIEVPAKRPDLAIARGAAYLPAERKLFGGVMQYPARENLTLTDLKPVTRRRLVSKRLETKEAHSWWSRLSIRPAGAYESPLVTFSGGNQQKVLFAKWLRRKPAVFLLDEPTQGVDVNAKALLHRELHRHVSSGGAALVSSADVDELVSLCHRVIILSNGRVAAQLEGSDVTVSQITKACLATPGPTNEEVA